MHAMDVLDHISWVLGDRQSIDLLQDSWLIDLQSLANVHRH